MRIDVGEFRGAFHKGWQAIGTHRVGDTRDDRLGEWKVGNEDDEVRYVGECCIIGIWLSPLE